MDKDQEEMQFLSLCGIYIESYKIIIRCRKICSQITLALIVPLSIIFLAHIEVSELLFSKILHNEDQLDETPIESKRHNKLSELISSEWANLLLFKFVYFTLLLTFSLLSTSAVVYTIACIYTARDVSFKKVMSVVPQVWKRLMATFLCAFLTFFAYNICLVLIMIIWAYTVGLTQVGIAILVVISIVYVVGFIYMTIVWQLASVVSVLEDFYGFKAMIKSNDLIKGKMWVAIMIFFMLNFSLLITKVLFERFVVLGQSFGVLGEVGFGILCLLLIVVVFLLGLVIQTVLYFVCKSYHHENIDKSTLSDHLEVFRGEYVPLKTKDVQLEPFQV